jgi:hypothetical protein
MKIYTFYSDSHKNLYDIFIKSLEETNPDLDLHTDLYDQSGSGIFMEDGWENMMSNKLDQIISACQKNKIFIHSDCDVYFLKNIKNRILEELGDFDIAFQNDGPGGLCMGFFICKPNDRIIEMFRKVKEILPFFNGHDQNALNSIIDKSGVTYKNLSPLFFNYGQKYRKIWEGEEFEIDPDILVLHANWTIGIENKMKIIEYVLNNK